MGIYERIVEWSAQRPLWQQDALRRLAQGGAPTVAEVARWTQMVRAEAQGVPCGAVPLTQGHVPAGASGPSVCLSAMSDLRNVNAIADGQRLEFATTGLTAVYGDNGAGKSGYARVLKRVCHARGAEEPILSNVFHATPATPEARVHFRVGDAAAQVLWKPGEESTGDLARISVFDSMAAVALLEQDNEVLWTPGGLDLLVRLGEVVQAVKQALAQEEASHAVPWQPPEVTPETSAARLLSQISAATTPRQLEALRLTTAEEEELARIEEALKATDSLELAMRVEQQAARIHAFQGKVAALESALGDAGIAVLRDTWQRLQDARQAEETLATSALSDSLIPGVGTGPWNTLWHAAEAFATSGATADGVFPSHATPCLCVLCQQPVAGTARDRLARFHSFVRSDVARRRESAAAALGAGVQQVQRLETPDPAREPTLNDVRELDADNAQHLLALLAAARVGKAAAAELLTAPDTWPEFTSLPAGWAQWLLGLVATLKARAQALREAAKPDERRALVARRLELTSRRVLYAAKARLEAELTRLRTLVSLAAAKKLCAIRGITDVCDALTMTLPRFPGPVC